MDGRLRFNIYRMERGYGKFDLNHQFFVTVDGYKGGKALQSLDRRCNQNRAFGRKKSLRELP